MKKRFSFPLAIVVIALVIAGLILWALHLADRRVALETTRAETIARDIGQFFTTTFQAQPTIVINERVFLEQTTAAQELAVIQRDTTVTRETTHQWLGSTKRIRIQALYAVKAGFDLAAPFTVRVTGTQLDIALPPARILSVEQKDISVEALENGLWNKITPRELETELAALPALARKKALDANIVAEAERLLLEKLRERFGDTYQITLTTIQPAE